MKKFKKLTILVAIIYGFFYIQNNHIETSFYSFKNEKVQDSLRIIQISDTHNKKFIFNNKFLIWKIKKLKPDIIIHTGDVATKNNNCENSFLMMEQLSKICPVYFIQGNHDVSDIDFNVIKENLEKIGVKVLINDSVELKSNNIKLVGLSNNLKEAQKYLKNNELDEDFYNICLIHKPINFEKMGTNQFDLFLSGHTHGCQWRFPFIGGIISPDKSFFPGKDYGYKVYNETEGIINRGLGNPHLIPRLNNFPEITVLNISSLDK